MAGANKAMSLVKACWDSGPGLDVPTGARRHLLDLGPDLLTRILRDGGSKVRLTCRTFRAEHDAGIKTLTVNNRFEDGAALTALLNKVPALSELDLRSCGIDSIAAVARCCCSGTLTLVKLPSRGHVDITPLVQCTQLTELHLNNCRTLTRLDALTTIPQLRMLTLTGPNATPDLHFLASCTKLQELDTGRTWWSGDLLSLAPCMQLKYLNLNLTRSEKLCEVRDVRPLAACVQLRHLVLRGCTQLNDISALAACTRLQHLDLENSHQLRDIAALAACTQLEGLDLQHCSSVVDLRPLMSCPRLQFLDASFNAVGDVTALRSCPMLRHLELVKCVSLVDISPLAACTSLMSLALAGTKVVVASPLLPCKRLVTLSLPQKVDVGAFLVESRRVSIMQDAPWLVGPGDSDLSS